MIRLSLLRSAMSTSSLRELWDAAVPAVVAELHAAGYITHRSGGDEPRGAGLWECIYRIEPGPATLSATAFDSEIIWINLIGPRFCGEGCLDRDNDAALWAQLEALASRLEAEHRVGADVSDPDIVIGVPGAPGTYLPNLPGTPWHRDDQS
jgi:hypothetical protein